MTKLWETNKKTDEKILSFTVGEDHLMDQVLLPYDIKGSLAHAKMLESIDILTEDELQKIENTLETLKKDYDLGKITLKQSDEDMHTFIENYLTQELGDTGKKIHTGRSRNDQVLTALRLYYKDQTKGILSLMKTLKSALKKHSSNTTPIPGYTHMQKAMPSSIGLLFSAYLDAMEDNEKLLEFITEHIDQSPLGTAAGYGSPLKLDRKMTADLLGFAKVQENPIYTQNSRGKFEALILQGLIQVMYDVNKIASDLILFSMPEFKFIDLPDEFCTGSSIMPQKKNPDVLEILRGKYHVLVGEQMKLLTMNTNLISGFHREMQLQKKCMIESFNTVQSSLDILALVIDCLQVNEKKCKQAMSDELFATQKVYDLVAQGMSFRDAYKQVKKDL